MPNKKTPKGEGEENKGPVKFTVPADRWPDVLRAMRAEGFVKPSPFALSALLRHVDRVNAETAAKSKQG